MREAVTPGDRLAGVDFNPSSDVAVQAIKERFAKLLDDAIHIKRGAEIMTARRPREEHQAFMALADAAIVNLQTAQMQLVKLLTLR